MLMWTTKVQSLPAPVARSRGQRLPSHTLAALFSLDVGGSRC